MGHLPDDLNKHQIPPPFLSLPAVMAGPKRSFTSPHKVETSEFYTFSDGWKRVYTASDALSGHGARQLLSLEEVSYMNLFINGVLQPKQSYQVENGRLTLSTDDLPVKGAPIVLQMITIR